MTLNVNKSLSKFRQTIECHYDGKESKPGKTSTMNCQIKYMSHKTSIALISANLQPPRILLWFSLRWV